MSVNENEISGKYPILSRGKIKLLYRNNTLYRAIEKDIIALLNQLGYVVECLRIDEHADSQAIREQARSILSKDGLEALVLPDHTCWQAIQHHREFEHLRYHFSHLDMLTSAAAIKSLFARLSIPPAPGASMNALIEDTLDAITQLMEMIATRNPSIRNCHIIQTGLGEHEPYLFTLISALAGANAPDIFPPDRTDHNTKLACDTVEKVIATKIAEAVQRANIRTTVHQDALPITDARDDVVICDSHFWKKHRSHLPADRTLTLPLASMIAQACEHDLLPPQALGDLISNLATEIGAMHQQLAKVA